MVRVAVFSLITFGMAYLLYVFPFLALLSLFGGGEILSLWSLLPTTLVFLLLRLYLATSITNRALRAFVHYGMGVGFLSALILGALLIVKWLGGFGGPPLGMAAVPAIGGLTAFSMFNANNFVIRNLTFESSRVDQSINIAFISDVHIGSNPPSHLSKICDLLRPMDINGLLIGGDLFDGSDFRLQDISALSGLETDIYFVTGNHEGYVGGLETILAKFPTMNIKVLENMAVDLHGINLIGVSDGQAATARAHAVDTLHRNGRFNIAMVHQPSIWRRTENEIDLMLCGHTHNGQIHPFNLLVRLQFRYVYGLYCEGLSNLYVSSGVGCWGPRMRLGSRNEIVMINLRPA